MAFFYRLWNNHYTAVMQNTDYGGRQMRLVEIYPKEDGQDSQKLSGVQYFIVAEDLFSDYGVPLLESYGVCVCINGKEEEKSVIRHITSSSAKIEELMELLLRNGVTPVSLNDVVEDWLAS